MRRGRERRFVDMYMIFNPPLSFFSHLIQIASFNSFLNPPHHSPLAHHHSLLHLFIGLVS